MKTHLFTLILCVSPAMLTVVSAQERKPDAPREERKPDAPREERRESGDRERPKAEEAVAAARAEIEQHLKAVMEQAAKLDAEGRKDAAEALRREAREKAQAAMQEHERAIHAKREAPERGREGADRRPDAPHGEIEGKLKHVEQAIGHLREAGMMDAAENIARLAERMRGAARGEGEPRREGVRREEPRREEPRREDARREEPRREEPRRVEERRPDGDIEALRREIQELRQAVRQLSEKQGR